MRERDSQKVGQTFFLKQRTRHKSKQNKVSSFFILFTTCAMNVLPNEIAVVR